MKKQEGLYIEGLKDATTKTKVLTLVLLFLVVLSISSTEVYYSYLTPFGISLIFALFYVGLSGYVLGLEFALAYFISNFSVAGIVISISAGVVLILGEYIRGRLKEKNKALKIWHVIIFYSITLIGLVVMSVGGLKENLALFVSIILSGIFLFICLHFLKGLFRRGIWIGLNLDEKICGSIIYFVMAIGATRISVSYLNLGIMLFPLTILLSIFICGNSVAMVLSIIAGSALSLYYLNPIYISMSVVLCAICLTFKGNFKILSAVAFELGYVVFVIIFKVGFDVSEFLSVLLGVIFFVLIPKKIIERASTTLSVGKEGLQVDMLDKIKSRIEIRLNNLSQVFDEMNMTYRSMIKGTLDDEKSIDLIKTELKRSVCELCPDRNNCYRLGDSFLENSFDMMVSNGYERGKVLLVDLPQYLTSNCTRVNSLIACLNSMLSDYKDYTKSINNLDASRVLIAEQLCATSKLLGSLSKDLSSVVMFDKKLEDNILEELRYRGIMCIEASVYQKSVSVKEVILIVNNSSINVKNIEKYVSKIVGVGMKVVETKPSSIEDASVVTLISSPNYDIAFGASQIIKYGSKFSGDNHAIIKIDDGKYLVSLSDGMGSGERAKKISDLTIRLVENFYKAGFDSDVILSTINKLLLIDEEENFATIDLCVIDGRNNTYDFIKFAGCNGYIIHDKGECEVVEGSNLPVGILDDVKPHVTKRLISNMDMLVLLSDGVEDALSPHLNIKDYLRSLDIINPQSLSDEIITKALDLSSGVAKDDMTVICVRVFGSN